MLGLARILQQSISLQTSFSPSSKCCGTYPPKRRPAGLLIRRDFFFCQDGRNYRGITPHAICAEPCGTILATCLSRNSIFFSFLNRVVATTSRQGLQSLWRRPASEAFAGFLFVRRRPQRNSLRWAALLRKPCLAHVWPPRFQGILATVEVPDCHNHVRRPPTTESCPDVTFAGNAA